MKAPDKIYFDGTSSACSLPVFSSQNIVYIRKDTLIEWAKQKQYESLTIVADNFWQEVIDKLNSL